MASNEVSKFNTANEAYEAARKGGVKGPALATLKAQRDAAKAECPRGSTGWGLLG